MPRTIHDSEYEIEAIGEETVLPMAMVVTCPVFVDEAALIPLYGNLTQFQDTIGAHL